MIYIRFWRKLVNLIVKREGNIPVFSEGLPGLVSSTACPNREWWASTMSTNINNNKNYVIWIANLVTQKKMIIT